MHFLNHLSTHTYSSLFDCIVYVGFSVSRIGDCAGYSWNIRWTSKPGDQPLMGVVGDDLVGPEVEIMVEATVDGGTWIRPLRGDMLRTPETEPQVCNLYHQQGDMFEPPILNSIYV